MIRFTHRDDDSIRYQYNARSDIASRRVIDGIKKIEELAYNERARQRRVAEDIGKSSFDACEIAELLNKFNVDMKLPGGSPRPLVSVLLDVVRMYTQTHNPIISSRLLTLSESINQIISRCVESGMNQSEITSEILLEPEVDDVRLDEFLHEFVVREGLIANA